MKRFFCTILAAEAIIPGCASAARPVGGQFEMFDVAVQGNRVVGRYLEEQGADRCGNVLSTSAGSFVPMAVPPSRHGALEAGRSPAC